MAGNNITIVGNVTRDPELRFTASGQATATFGIAVNRRWQNRQTNEWEEAVSFFNVVTWRELAENAAESLHKGTRVLVSGRLEQRSWETPDGEKKTVVDIVADEVGPSLRWASAQIVRNERRTGEGGPQGGGPSSQGGAPQGRSGGGGGGQGSQGSQGSQGGYSRPAPAAAPAGGYDYDEEPF
jgi:single-strand DNA-binding protein